MVVSSTLDMQAVNANQQSMMHRLFTQGNAGSTPPQRGSSGIEDIANRLHKQQNGNGHNDYSDDALSLGEVSMSNNTPNMSMTCVECGIVKHTSEDMEIHIKIEHLNWLPFQCPICLADRASDAQMREHLHSQHRKTMNKFIYVDDLTAKRKLQQMMDSAIHASVTKTNGRCSSPVFPPDDKHDLFKRATPSNVSESPPAEPSPVVSSIAKNRSVKVEISSGDTNTDALLASITRAAHGVSDQSVDDNIANFVFNGFKNMTGDFDATYETEDGIDNENEDNVLESLVNPISVLDNVAALFSNTTENRTEEGFTIAHERKPINTKIVTNQVSKKRVLGECSKCNKPVTAGARQMHMFFHLAKDHKTYRFRCLFEGCTVEHYRKDQMENHQSKIHGKIDPDMMEDRSLELFSRCQDLSMELLGTKSGATPGPTAAKAEMSYNALLKDKDRKDIKTIPQRMVPDEEHPLECRLCHKTMQNRIRGFHILWHLAKDMGIMRYICKFCGFAHDRSQSVQTHGKKEHGADDVVLDKIKEYESEVNMMSEKCFGFQSSFAQDNKRRSKIPVIIPTSSIKRKKIEIEETIDGTIPSDSDEVKSIEDSPVDHEDDTTIEHEYEEDEESKPVRKRKSIRSARFGTRRPASKTKRVEMLRLREISMLIGGAQYYKKKSSETAVCEKCDKITNSRLTEHAYTHMRAVLFTCPSCDFGAQTRDNVLKHIGDRHANSDGKPVDNRLKYAKEIKEAVRECYSAFFVDAPIPTVADIEKLRKGTDHIAGIGEEHDSGDDHAEEDTVEDAVEAVVEAEDDDREGVLEMDEVEDEEELTE